MGRILTSTDQLDVLCVVCLRNLPLPNAAGFVVCDCEIIYPWGIVHSALTSGPQRDTWRAVCRRDGYRVDIQIHDGVKSAVVSKPVSSG